MTPRIDLIAGARPNFMKIAPIIRALPAHAPGLAFRLVHTGQHYDRNMSGAFFEQLGIPEPDVNLEVGSGSQAEQTAGIMVKYERLLLADPSDLTLVVGDVTSTLACTIVARKLGLPVAHVEGGLRSGDWTMPEEINRVVTDSIATLFFTTSEGAGANLRREGVTEDRIHFVGNTMIDTLVAHLDRLRPPSFWTEAGLQPGGYLVATLHRPANVDHPEKLHALLAAIGPAARGLPVVFPVHPRTRARLDAATLPTNFLPVDPQPYLEFNHLVRHARAVITDSGGITEETTWLGVPCFTLRDCTERPETIDLGTNELLGTDPARIGPALDRLFEHGPKAGRIPPLWDGRAGERIATHLHQLLVPA